jgi:nitrogen fixation protein FixH
MNMTQEQESKTTGRQVLIWLLGFFGVCMAVNGFFVYIAVTTNWGVVDENAYQTGLHYNALLEEARKQKDEKQRGD